MCIIRGTYYYRGKLQQDLCYSLFHIFRVHSLAVVIETTRGVQTETYDTIDFHELFILKWNTSVDKINF